MTKITNPEKCIEQEHQHPHCWTDFRRLINSSSAVSRRHRIARSPTAHVKGHTSLHSTVFDKCTRRLTLRQRQPFVRQQWTTRSFIQLAELTRRSRLNYANEREPMALPFPSVSDAAITATPNPSTACIQTDSNWASHAARSFRTAYTTARTLPHAGFCCCCCCCWAVAAALRRWQRWWWMNNWATVTNGKVVNMHMTIWNTSPDRSEWHHAYN